MTAPCTESRRRRISSDRDGRFASFARALGVASTAGNARVLAAAATVGGGTASGLAAAAGLDVRTVRCAIRGLAGAGLLERRRGALDADSTAYELSGTGAAALAACGDVASLPDVPDRPNAALIVEDVGCDVLLGLAAELSDSEATDAGTLAETAGASPTSAACALRFMARIGVAERSGRGYRLTERGRRLLEIVDEWAAAQADATKHHSRAAS